MGSTRRTRSVLSSPTSSTSCPTVLEVAGLPEPTFVNGVQQTPLPGASMAYCFDDADAAERHETQYFEMSRQPRDLSPRVDRRDEAQHAVAARRRHRRRVRRRRLGALRHQRRLDAGPGRRRRASRTRFTSCSACGSSRPPGTACCRWTTALRRAAQLRHGRPATTRTRQPAGALRRHGPAVREQRGQHQEQVARGHRRGRRERSAGTGRHRRAGRQHRRLEPVREGRQAEVLLQPAGHQAVLRRRRSADPDRHSTRSGWSSLRRRRARQGWQRGALSSTAPGPARAAWTRPRR